MQHANRLTRFAAISLAVLATTTFSRAAEPPSTFTLASESAYANGHGFDVGSAADTAKPAIFSVKLPEGTYLVRLKLGGPAAAVTTVKSECRQLQIENLATAAGETKDVTIAVNIRTPEIAGGRGVGLKTRAGGYSEGDNLRWDDKLSLEFGAPKGNTWAVQSVEITPAPELPVIYVVGDSTVCDQPGEPYNSWGQMLPRWFKPDIAVANHAESGESYQSFLAERRWTKILTTIKKGDFVLMQMGHNDEKIKQDNYANTGFTANMKKIIAEAREKGATPVLVTPMNRYTWTGTEVTNSHGQFPDAVRALAQSESVPLVDLFAASKTLYEALGKDGCIPLFAPNDKGGFDHTHQSDYGGYELSKCIAVGLKSAVPTLAAHLRDDLPAFDPAKPDAFADFKIPTSPNAAKAKPAGN
jgi:lysophospholipase L1-like esterase